MSRNDLRRHGTGIREDDGKRDQYIAVGSRVYRVISHSVNKGKKGRLIKVVSEVFSGCRKADLDHLHEELFRERSQIAKGDATDLAGIEEEKKCDDRDESCDNCRDRDTLDAHVQVRQRSVKEQVVAENVDNIDCERDTHTDLGMSVTPDDLQHDTEDRGHKSAATDDIKVHHGVVTHLGRHLKEIHDQRICQAENPAQEYAENEVDHDGERIDHVRLVEFLGTEILGNDYGRGRGDDVEENVHHEKNGIGITDRADRELVVVAEHERVDVVEHRVEKQLKKQRTRKDHKRCFFINDNRSFLTHSKSPGAV